MDTTEIIGFCAMCLTALKQIPQIYKIHTEDDVTSFSKQAIYLALLSSVLWTYYGIRKNSRSVIVMSLCAIVYEMYLLLKILKSDSI
jgi:Ca2+/H+ antiporter